MDKKKALQESLKLGDQFLEITSKPREKPVPSYVEQGDKELVQYNTIKYTVHNSVLLLGSDPMTITESKILRLIIANAQSRPGKTDFPVYQTTIPQLAETLNTSQKSLYNAIERIAHSLMDRKLYIRYENKKKDFEMYHWCGWASYRDGIFSIKLSSEITDFFLGLKGNFTIFEHLDQLMGYKCRYSISISEALLASVKRDPIKRQSYDHGKIVKVEYSIDNFRWFTSTQERYKDPYDLKKRVIEPAVKEISAFSEMTIEEYKLEKRGVSKAANTVVFYVYDKYRRGNTNQKPVEVQSFFLDDEMRENKDMLTETYVRQQFDASNAIYHQDQIAEIMARYTTVSEFMEDYCKACENSDYSIVQYMLAIARNKAKTERKIKRGAENRSWDTLEFQTEFDEIQDYWNSIAAKQKVEADAAGANDVDMLKEIRRKDFRLRKHYCTLINEGETKESVLRAIDVAAVSQFFLRTSGNFGFFINPKNYFDIASGERDYDSEAVRIWKQMREN